MASRVKSADYGVVKTKACRVNVLPRLTGSNLYSESSQTEDTGQDLEVIRLQQSFHCGFYLFPKADFMKRMSYLVVVAALFFSVAWIPAHAAGDPGLFTTFVRPRPDFGTVPTGNGGCGTSPENPTVLLVGLGLAGMLAGRRISRMARLRTVSAAQ